ncbi:PHB depolymerase family esterase (plasmid) [Skermanella sp. TT6]|uniref:PHB depolymerase family esterase n=1 Tax=Skermanella cutis TaxID=2775420 RepID=A0ABX7BM20_9PROT|nr:PHB depolymerase family esterase [Skermanella sp. TT6]QQP93483.1 PHB depolymerase family esterase [Skermanella sp. TT6]
MLRQDDGTGRDGEQGRETARRLARDDGFGPNPGNLVLYKFVPDGLEAGAPLVVVLHGCGQTAAGYDEGAGWSRLAERWGFALLYPEQRRENNQGGCFNWFEPGDIERDAGEAASIRAMVERMRQVHGTDPSRTFVSGLSAGGAMAVVMLATYPETFAGGGVIAGLPYKAALGLREALGAMFRGRAKSPAEWGELVRQASGHEGPWPVLSIWHGTADRTVAAMNAAELANQWACLHGAPGPAREGEVAGQRHLVLHDRNGRAVVELYEIDGMAHGTPIGPGEDDEPLGVAGQFILDAGISSTYRIARFWGLGPRQAEPRTEPPAETAPPARIPAEPVFAIRKPAGAGLPGRIAGLWARIKRAVSRRR